MSTPISLTPVYKELLGDLETPVSVYMKLNRSDSFLLESVTGGEQVARYSFIGFDPFCVFAASGDQVKIQYRDKQVISTANPIDALQSVLEEYELVAFQNLPPFLGGAVGYFSWEVMRHIESLETGHDSDYPMAHYLFPQSLVIFDHALRKLILVVLAEPGQTEAAQAKLEALELCLRQPLAADPISIPAVEGRDIFDGVKSTFSKDEFIRAVESAKHAIFEGDVFQLVLSQQFSLSSPKRPFDVYRTLRYINPSPYMYYFDFDTYQVIGSSPEILACLEGRKAFLRPIAGTRPRIKDQEDAMVQSLLADEKERAEHIMLVDLARNDLGRVCDYESVVVSGLMHVEKYSHVMHMVSDVEGVLQEGKTAFDLFKASFPAGTVSGAPKIRAMQIISELEPQARGPYAGALGYFDFRGNMDLCIIIRTILSKNGQYFIQAGAGIVADSVPESEYEETRNKAKGVVLACLE